MTSNQVLRVIIIQLATTSDLFQLSYRVGHDTTCTTCSMLICRNILPPPRVGNVFTLFLGCVCLSVNNCTRKS